MPAMTFPRTMTRGKFAGQTFETITEYQSALRRNSKPKRKPAARRKPASSNGGPQRKPAVKKDEHAEAITWIIGMYESYRNIGAGPSQALANTIEYTRS